MPVESPPYRTNIGLHYNLPLQYESYVSRAYGFQRKPESLIGIFTPSVSFAQKTNGRFHLIELTRLGFDLPPSTITRNAVQRDSVTGQITDLYAQASYQSKVEIALRYEYNLPFLRKIFKPESRFHCFMGLSLQLMYFEGIIGPHVTHPFQRDIQQQGFNLGVHPHIQYTIGRHWLLDSGVLLPFLMCTNDISVSHNPALTERQRSTGGFSVDSSLIGVHFRLGLHYML